MGCKLAWISLVFECSDIGGIYNRTFSLDKEFKNMREMKDSGIEWVGKIPNCWNSTRGKFLFSNHKIIVGSKVEDYERLALTLMV